MKRLLSAFVILFLFAAVNGALPAGAVMARFWQIGDVDRDYDLSIRDVTRIQRLLAGFDVITELDEALGDANGSGRMDILDATCIQRYLVDLPSGYRYRELTDYHVGDTAFHNTAEIDAPGAEASSEIAYVGVPVTYTGEIKWSNPPQHFCLSVNGESVWERNANGDRRCAVTYTFTEEGAYDVALEIRCKYGVVRTFRRRVEVRSLPADGCPVIMGAAFLDQSWMSSGSDDLTVIAAGGTAPYTYQYTIYYAQSPDAIPADEIALSADPDAESGEATIPLLDRSDMCLVTGYIGQDTINPPQLLKRPTAAGTWYNLYVRITVRDAAGRESAPVTVECVQYQICL